MLRRCYVIDAENGVGLYFSEWMMKENFEKLSKFDRRVIEFNTYDEAKKYIFKQYEGDSEINLEKFRVNFTIMRDTSKRYCFYVQSKKVLGFGISKEMRTLFENFLPVSANDIVEVSSKREAENGARYGFVNEYGNQDYYYAGMLLPGESISFAEMMRCNNIDPFYPETVLKLNGICM